MIHFQAAQKLVGFANYCFEKLAWMSTKKRAIIHCDKYTHIFPLCHKR